MESSLSEQDTFSSGNAVYVIGLIGVAGVSLLRKVLLDIGLMRLLEPIRLDFWRLGYDLFFALVLPCVGIVCYVHTRRLALPRWLMVTRWVVGAYLAYTVVKGGFRLLFLGLDVAGLFPDFYPVVRGGIWLVCAMASIGVIGAALRYPQWRLCASPFLFFLVLMPLNILWGEIHHALFAAFLPLRLPVSTIFVTAFLAWVCFTRFRRPVLAWLWVALGGIALYTAVLFLPPVQTLRKTCDHMRWERLTAEGLE